VGNAVVAGFTKITKEEIVTKDSLVEACFHVKEFDESKRFHHYTQEKNIGGAYEYKEFLCE
jgi:hypothetical protein